MKTILVSLSVIVLAVAGVMVSVNRANVVRDNAAAVQAAADKAEAEAKTAKRNADAETARKSAAEASARAAADELAAKKLAAETAETAAQTAADNKAAAEASARAERDKLEAARVAKDAERAKTETARMEQEKARELVAAESAKADAEAARLALEKLKADKVLAEAKLLELRKIDFETLQRDLMEWKLDLEERERALAPEKTITDLGWAGGMEDTVFDEDGNLKKQAKAAYDPEKDMSLPPESRRLAKAQRAVNAQTEASAGNVRNAVVAAMERLYVDALKGGRTIDAEFYRKTLKSMYPDWEFKGEK